MQRSALKPLLLYAGIGFVLHWMWEVGQAPLFTCFVQFRRCMWLCFRAAVTGDLAMMLLIYACLALVHRRNDWPMHRSAFHHPATWILPIVIGMLLATNVEFWAVFVAHRWEYSATMPLIPWLHIGLTPVLQMIIVPLATTVLLKQMLHGSLAQK